MSVVLCQSRGSRQTGPTTHGGRIVVGHDFLPSSRSPSNQSKSRSLFDHRRSTDESCHRAYESQYRQASGRKRPKSHSSSGEAKPSFDNSLAYLQDNIDDFKSLIPCGGLILRIAGNTLTSGTVPSTDDIAPLLDTLWEASQGSRLTTNCLPTRFPNLEALRSVACGALSIPLGTHRRDIAVWIRPEQIQDVKWAGCPNENVHVDTSQAPIYRPARASKFGKTKRKGPAFLGRTKRSRWPIRQQCS